MSQYKNFNHTFPVQVRFGDIDAMNHVNNAKYLTYVESARIKYIRQVLGTKVDHSTISLILAKATIDFVMPILYEDEITVFTRCSRLGTKSFDVEFEIVKTTANGMETIAKGFTILVAFDYEKQTTIVIPDEWKEKFTAFEDTEFEKPH